MNLVSRQLTLVHQLSCQRPALLCVLKRTSLRYDAIGAKQFNRLISSSQRTSSHCYHLCLNLANHHPHLRSLTETLHPSVCGLGQRRWIAKEVPPAIENLAPDQDEQKENERKRQNHIRATRYSLMVLGLMACSGLAYAITEWGPPRIDSKGNIMEDEFSKYPIFKQYILRCWDTLTNYNEAFKEPARELLLPDPLQAPYIQPPYTLVIESNGVLMHPDWTYKTGWRFKKRPFVEYLLQQCAPPLFEIVIFTQDPGHTAYPIIDALDPNGFIIYRLFRDSTRYENGVRIKDLNCLNRDLSKVIFIDWDKNACKFNTDNCLVLKKWQGDGGDKSLFDLAQFLRAIATQEVSDVREVIAHYRQFDDPLEAFKERQRQLIEQEEETSRQESAKAPSYLNAFKRK